MYPKIIVPPFANKSFFDFTKEEAKQYFKWFNGIKTERIKILESYIQKSYPGWEANYTKSSLKILYEWLGKHVEYRPTTEGEKREIEDQINKTPLFVNIIPIPKFTFTDETVSICFDAALYFGETLISNVDGLKWIQKLSSIKYIDYGQPLISKGKSKVPLNPRRVAESFADNLLKDRKSDVTFESLFEKWKDEF
jgi:hypothetical protein